MLYSCVYAGNIATVQYIRANNAAIQRGDLVIECGIKPFNDGVYVYKSDSQAYSFNDAVKLCTRNRICYNDASICTRCVITATDTAILINITQLDRAHHQKHWICASGTGNKSMYLSVNNGLLQPKSFSYIGNTDGNPTFFVESSFNDGYKQTFVIEISANNSGHWKENMMFNDTETAFKKSSNCYIFNISTLQPNSYIARIKAINDTGQAHLIPGLTVQFTIIEHEYGVITDPCCHVTTLVIASASGVVLVNVIALAIVLIKQRQGNKNRIVERREFTDKSDNHGVSPTYNSLQHVTTDLQREYVTIDFGMK